MYTTSIEKVNVIDLILVINIFFAIFFLIFKSIFGRMKILNGGYSGDETNLFHH